MLKLLSLTPTIKAIAITAFIVIIFFSVPLGIFVYLYNSYRVSYESEIKTTSSLSLSNTQLRTDIDTQNTAIQKMVKESLERTEFIKKLQTNANVLAKKNEDLAKQLLEEGKKIPSNPGQPATIEECQQVEELMDKYIAIRKEEIK